MQFYQGHHLIWLFAVPVFLFLLILSRRVWFKQVNQFFNYSALKDKLLVGYNSRAFWTRAFLISLAMIFSILALSEPQWGEEKEKIQRKGIDIIFLLDTSLSMLSEDVAPNRFLRSKLTIKDFVRKLKGDRVGMIGFAGSSFLQTPLTLDYSTFMLFLDGIEVGFIPDPGTSLDRAVQMALQSFPDKDLKHKAVVLFSDGEDHEGGLENALSFAKQSGLRIYTIGVGTKQGAPIPLKGENKQRVGFKKDRSGQIVITRLNEDTLKKIASETGGLHLPSTAGGQEVDLILKHMSSLGQKSFAEKIVSEKEDHFQLFLIIAMSLLILELLYSPHQKIKKKILPVLIVLITFLSQSAFLETSQSLTKKGNKLFSEKKYQSALEQYQKAKVQNPDSPEILYNLGTTYYQLQQYQEAAKELEKAAKNSKEPALKAQSYYNLGNAQYRLGNFEGAIKSYEKALEYNPDDKDAKYNLEFLQNQKKSFEQKNQNRQNQNQNQNQQNNQQDQQNQNQNQQNQQNQDNQSQSQNQSGQGNSQDQQNQGQGQEQQNQGSGQDQEQQQNSDGQGSKDPQNQQNKQDQQKSDQQSGQNKDQSQSEQNQGQGQEQQDQDQKNQQNQQQKDQKNQGQNQNDQSQQQHQDDEQEKQNNPSKDDKEDNQQNPQKQQGSQESQDQNNQEQEQNQQNKPSDEQGDQEEEKPQDQAGQNQKQGEEEEEDEQDLPQNQPQAGGQASGGRGQLQGQMSVPDALRILDALRESEKELQDLRRPPVDKKPPQVDKDW